MPHRVPKPRKKWEIVREIAPLPEDHPLKESREIEFVFRVRRNGYREVLSRKLIPRSIPPMTGTVNL